MIGWLVDVKRAAMCRFLVQPLLRDRYMYNAHNLNRNVSVTEVGAL